MNTINQLASFSKTRSFRVVCINSIYHEQGTDELMLNCTATRQQEQHDISVWIDFQELNEVMGKIRNAYDCADLSAAISDKLLSSNTPIAELNLIHAFGKPAILRNYAFKSPISIH